MEVLRKRGMKVEDVFSLDDSIYPHYLDVYTKTEYSKIPKHLRGIAKGYEEVDRHI